MVIKRMVYAFIHVKYEFTRPHGQAEVNSSKTHTDDGIELLPLSRDKARHGYS